MSDYKHIWQGKPEPDSLMVYLGISEREYMELVNGKPMSEDDYKQTLTVGELKDFEARRRRDSIDPRIQQYTGKTLTYPFDKVESDKWLYEITKLENSKMLKKIAQDLSEK